MPLGTRNRNWFEPHSWAATEERLEEERLATDGGTRMADPAETRGGMLSPAPGKEESYDPRDDGVDYDFEPPDESYGAFVDVMTGSVYAADGGHVEETMAEVSHSPPEHTDMDNPEL